MSCILHIETSTEACSVAVSEDGLAVFSKEDLKGPSHAVLFIDKRKHFLVIIAIHYHKSFLVNPFTVTRPGLDWLSCSLRDISAMALKRLS